MLYKNDEDNLTATDLKSQKGFEVASQLHGGLFIKQ